MSLRKGVIKRLYFVLLTAWMSSFWSTCLLLEHEHWISLMCKFSPCSIFLSTEALTFNETKWSSLYMVFADIISSILIIIFALRSFELVFSTWLQFFNISTNVPLSKVRGADCGYGCARCVGGALYLPAPTYTEPHWSTGKQTGSSHAMAISQ